MSDQKRVDPAFSKGPANETQPQTIAEQSKNRPVIVSPPLAPTPQPGPRTGHEGDKGPSPYTNSIGRPLDGKPPRSIFDVRPPGQWPLS
jgi:hypothetical protein